MRINSINNSFKGRVDKPVVKIEQTTCQIKQIPQDKIECQPIKVQGCVISRGEPMKTVVVINGCKIEKKQRKGNSPQIIWR